MHPPAIQALLDADPSLKIKYVKPTMLSVVNSMLEALRHASRSVDYNTQMLRHFEVIFLNTITTLNEKDMGVFLDQLVVSDYTRIGKEALVWILQNIPKEAVQYKRIRGSIAFELHRHYPAAEVNKLLKGL